MSTARTGTKGHTPRAVVKPVEDVKPAETEQRVKETWFGKRAKKQQKGKK